MKRPLFLLSVLLIALLCFYSCTTVTPSFPPSIDYTDSRSVTREMEAVRSLIEEKPLDALLRVKRLILYTENTDETNTLYQEAKSNV